jgi:RNA polymerase sigma factor (TIGR02999 family)
MGEVTLLLKRIGDGDAQARDRLFELLYEDLRRLAHSRIRRSETITLLDTTSLVHDTYLRLVNARELAFEDRGKFFGYAASVMRAIVVDAVRARRADRRGGGAIHVVLDTQIGESAEHDDNQVVAVHEALEELAKLDPRLVKVVEMRYFAGLTEEEIATSLGITERTVRRDWEKARALLFGALK